MRRGLPPQIAQILRFSVSGAISVPLYYLLFVALTEVAGVWYLGSSVMAFAISYGASFLLQKLWTFKSRDLKSAHRQLALHMSLCLANLALNTALLYLLVEYARFWYLSAQVILTIALSIESYFISRLIFARKPTVSQ